MRNFVLATAAFAAIVAATPSAQADMVGAAAGAGVGLVVAGPVGAVAGGVVGAVYGKPFWGPSISRGHCWTDNGFHRHCNKHWSAR
jgi:osmotically inducible lipoprotein OsmB